MNNVTEILLQENEIFKQMQFFFFLCFCLHHNRGCILSYVSKEISNFLKLLLFHKLISSGARLISAKKIKKRKFLVRVCFVINAKNNILVVKHALYNLLK